MNQPIHVVYIITKLELGGAQKVCLSLFHGLSSTKYTCHLISGTKGSLVSTIENNSHVYLIDSMIREISLGALIQEVKNFIFLIRHLRSLRKKYVRLIVHTHSTKAGIIGRWAAFFAGISLRVHTIHGYGFHRYQSRITWYIIYLLELFTSTITTHFICVCTDDTRTGIRLFPRFKHKYSIIPAGVDWQQFYQPAKSYSTSNNHNPFIFGTISCFKPQKNLIDLLQAFAYVYYRTPYARLEIIGDGIQRNYLEQWINDHQLGQVITLHGWQQSVAPIMKRWHAFTLSSLWEGLPCAVVEARLLHLPVISYDVGGIREIIIHEQNGLICWLKKG